MRRLGQPLKAWMHYRRCSTTTAASVEDTKPVLTKMNTMMGKQLPSTLQAATDSLNASKEAARSLESTIKSLDTFRTVMSAVPLVQRIYPCGSAPV